jgi:hypothetical protein
MSNSSDEVAYWFPEWNVLCRKYGKEYSVINGNWEFIYDPSTGLRRFPNERLPINDIVCYLVEVTRDSFREMGYEPEWYYW